MSNRLDHALHNELACDYLSTDEQFRDWVITTAFYSSLHFVQHKMFPGNAPINGVQVHCKDFSDYYNRIAGRNRTDKHAETINLVWQVLPTIGPDYQRLYEICRDSRYRNYRVSKKQADVAREMLGKIKDLCDNRTAVTSSAQAQISQ